MTNIEKKYNEIKKIIDNYYDFFIVKNLGYFDENQLDNFLLLIQYQDFIYKYDIVSTPYDELCKFCTSKITIKNIIEIMRDKFNSFNIKSIIHKDLKKEYVINFSKYYDNSKKNNTFTTEQIIENVKDTLVNNTDYLYFQLKEQIFYIDLELNQVTLIGNGEDFFKKTK